MISSLTVGLTGLFLLATLAARWLNNRHDPREPPNVNTAIPIIGHLLGMMKHGHRYYLVAGYVLLPMPSLARSNMWTYRTEANRSRP